MTEDYDLVDNIISYEHGDLDSAGTLKLFSFLIETGLAWQLQGMYGRAAERLIKDGIISKKGEILNENVEYED